LYYFFPGMIVGIVLFQSALVAPTLFRELEISEFGVVIRALWPKFFLCITLLGIITIITLYLTGQENNIHYIIGLLTIILAGICYLIIPATNRASDEGNKKLFDSLHRISVSFTLIILLSNIAFLAI